MVFIPTEGAELAVTGRQEAIQQSSLFFGSLSRGQNMVQMSQR